MIVKVETEDILSGGKPIENAVKRQHGLDCIVDRKFLVVKGNERFARRLPVSAELFMYELYVGNKVEPFQFEI